MQLCNPGSDHSRAPRAVRDQRHAHRAKQGRAAQSNSQRCPEATRVPHPVHKAALKLVGRKAARAWARAQRHPRSCAAIATLQSLYTRVCAFARSGKLAAVTTDKVVYLFDDSGERRDKFKTKPADSASTSNYIVRALAFSPDSTKLAVAQSDNIGFVYR